MVVDLLEELQTLKQAKALGDALKRLQLHPDFKLVFDNHLFMQLPLKLVMRKAELSESERVNDEESLLCISYLKKHLSDVITEGDTAIIEISEIEKRLEEGETL